MTLFKKKILDKYYFVKSFISGLILKKKDLFLIKVNNNNDLKLSYIKIDNNNIYLYFNKKKIYLLLNKKEFFLINFFLKKKYFCLPIKIFKINSFFKIIFFLVKKRG
ncbi:MAG: hypothetical protein ACSLEG_00350 [Candidatus Carsonella ruddii]